MKYLIDTCVYIWIITNNQQRISKKAQEILSDAENNSFYVSIISQIETTIKHHKFGIAGMNLPIINYYQQVRIKTGIDLLGLEQEDIATLAKLPKIHNDPFDKLLISQALNNNMTIVSPDKKFEKYPVRVIY